MRRAKLSEADKADIKLLYRRGYKIPAIAKKYNIDPKTVRRYLGSLYDPAKDAKGQRIQQNTPLLREKIVPHLAGIYARLQAGETLRSMESEFGVSDSYIEELLRINDYPLPTHPKRKLRYDVGNHLFIEAWQTSDYITEVCEKTGMPYTAVMGRAGNLKSRGIPLKLMKREFSWRMNLDELREFAEMFLPQEDEGGQP